MLVLRPGMEKYKNRCNSKTVLYRGKNLENNVIAPPTLCAYWCKNVLGKASLARTVPKIVLGLPRLARNGPKIHRSIHWTRKSGYTAPKIRVGAFLPPFLFSLVQTAILAVGGQAFEPAATAGSAGRTRQSQPPD
jgi:hypothetical protein